MQEFLFPDWVETTAHDRTSSTFTNNMRLPVHRWFRYSAGFSAEWVESVIADMSRQNGINILDKFEGAGTTLLAAEKLGMLSFGVDAHPFISRVAKAKLQYRSDPEAFLVFATEVKTLARRQSGPSAPYPPLIEKCFATEPLAELDRLRRAWEALRDETPASDLTWLALVAILRSVSHAGTAPWQYVLPRKSKKAPAEPLTAFDNMIKTIYADMQSAGGIAGPRAIHLETDARNCFGVPDASIDLVITSPPYANNYDYADATRLEMCFMREIDGWADLGGAVRDRLMRSCTQHVPEKSGSLTAILGDPLLEAIRDELGQVCQNLATIRRTKGGKKTYHLMMACYFSDMARVWKALRRCCKPEGRACFVIGDSAPYGVYAPVAEWTGALAVAAGFKSFQFEKTRDRNVKWKNRKHRVPLCEGRLWVEG